MTRFAFAFAIAVIVAACSALTDETEEKQQWLPDGTLMVQAYLESAAEVPHDVPVEVFVGRLYDQGREYDPFSDSDLPALWESIEQPILHGNVIDLNTVYKMKIEGVNDARVSLTDLSDADRHIGLSYRDGGSYTTPRSELPILPNHTYRLEITLPNGETYEATTSVPTRPVWEGVPDTVVTPLDLLYFRDGTIGETSERNHLSYFPSIVFEEGPRLSVISKNASYDAFLMTGTMDDANLKYGDRGPYLREGTHFNVLVNRSSPYQVESTWNLDCSLPVKSSLTNWMRFSVLSSDVTKFYDPEFPDYAVADEDKYLDLRYTFDDAWHEKDAQYLYEISNIEAVTPGAPPAVGVFGSYSSVYRKSVLIPERSWDPDTLSNWPCR